MKKIENVLIKQSTAARNILTVRSYKDVLLKRIEHEYIYCDTELVINGRF